MKEKLRKPYVILLITAMVFTLVMAFTACGKENGGSSVADSGTPAALATLAPGEDMDMTVEGPASLQAGETVVYRVSVTGCAVREGLIGVDFTVEYNTDLLSYESAALTVSPSASWEALSREEQTGKRIFSCFDDSNETLTPVTKDGQFTVELTFKVTDKPESGEDYVVRLFDVCGAKNDDAVSMCYGTGNEIKKDK